VNTFLVLLKYVLVGRILIILDRCTSSLSTRIYLRIARCRAHWIFVFCTYTSV